MSLAQDVPVRPGDLLAQKYRVEKVLGAGAMGVVVAAMHEDLRERRAIKFMLPQMLGDTEGVERFLREARAAVRLKSQHVAKIHDIGRLETGAPYMVMEYLEGGDLKQLLQERGALPVPEAVGYLLQVCEAIAEAHALGIVHRDLKPANLYLTTGANGAPCVKVLDFGIAKLIGGPDAGDMTRTSALLGTPLYMSPEQMRGARSIDGRSDIWALGAILYRMLTGRTPFSGSSVTEICAAVVADQPDPPAMHRPEIPPALEAAVMRCLEKNPARRFATANELAATIGPFASPRPAAAPQNASLHGTAFMIPSEAYRPPVSMGPQAASHPGPAERAPSPAAPVQPVPAPPPVAAAPVAAAPVAVAAPPPPAPAAPPPPAVAAATAPGGTTNAPGWTPAGAPVAPPRSSGKAVVIAATVVVLALGGGTVAAVRLGARTPPSVAASEPAPSVTAVATAEAAASVAPAATATAAAAETSAHATSAEPAPARPAGRAPGTAPGSKAKSTKDAFGAERK